VTGFGLPANDNGWARLEAVVRKPPGKEGAGCGAARGTYAACYCGETLDLEPANEAAYTALAA